MAAAALLLAFLAVCASAETDFELEFANTYTRPWSADVSTRGYRRRLYQDTTPPGAYPPPFSPPISSPSPQGAGESPPPEAPTCSGVAYDGYLSNCQLRFAVFDQNSLVEPIAATVTVTDGKFNTGKKANQLGSGFLTPAPTSIPRTAVPAGRAIDFCFDTTTRLPEFLPLATVAPSDCSKPVVVDITSTLLQYGLEAEVKDNSGIYWFSAAALKKAFAISQTVQIGQFDAIAAANGTDVAEGLKVLKVQSTIRNFVTIVARTRTRDGGRFEKVVKQVFVALARRLTNKVADAPQSTRRLSQEDALLDLSSPDELQELFTMVEQQIAAGLASGPATLATSDVGADIPAEVKQAISNAVAAINAITQRSPSASEVQKATQVVVTSLTTSLDTLIKTGNVAAFERETTPEVLSGQVGNARLEGEVVIDEGGDNKGALIGGLVGGLVGGLLLIAVVAGIFLYRKRRNGAPAAAAAN